MNVLRCVFVQGYVHMVQRDQDTASPCAHTALRVSRHMPREVIFVDEGMAHHTKFNLFLSTDAFFFEPD